MRASTFVSVVALIGAAFAARERAAEAGESRDPKPPKPVKVRHAPEKYAEELLRKRTGVRKAEDRLAEAEAAGPMTITGEVTLSGVVYASSLHIAESASVVIQGGTAIVVSGAITIESAVGGELKPETPGAKRPPEPENQDVIFEAGEDIVIDGELVGADGATGFESLGQNSAQGGAGGRGQGFGFVSGGTIVVRADVIPGRGGEGGRAEAIVDGVASGDVVARGGNGGAAGSLFVIGRNVNFEGGRFCLRRGGRGGDAFARSGDAPATARIGGDCTSPGGRAGRALAYGGHGGPGTAASAGSEVVFNATFKAESPAGIFHVLQEDTFVPGRILNASALPFRMLDSEGGDATAVGGDGGSPPDCEADDICPARGPRPGAGGDGGDAEAYGGQGGALPFLICSEASFEPSAVFAFDIFESPGGSVWADGGDGGVGANAAPAKRPAAGGRGGPGGGARAKPGLPGGGPFVVGLGDAIVFRGRIVPLDAAPADVDPSDFRDLVWNAYGEAEARAGDAGVGGNGGDCCDRPGGPGGAAGAAGDPGFATGGLSADVFRIVGTSVYVFENGGPGAAGLPGLACPPEDDPDLGGGSADDAIRIPRLEGQCVNMDGEIAPIVGFDFYFPGTSEGLAPVPADVVLEFGAAAFGVQDDRVEIYINGKKVMDRFFAEFQNVISLGRVFVRTPKSGRICVEIRVNGVATQRLRFETF